MSSSVQWSIILVCLFLSFPNLTVAKGESVQGIVRSLGFQSINTKPVDFELVNIDGQTLSLKGFQGKWTFLTFWATWCGACKQQMPILETLQLGFEHKGLNVVGVSIDDDETAVVAEYVKRNELSYEILHDRAGTVAAKYLANSIPTTYLVSPNLRLVGVVRGVANWEDPKHFAAIENLLAINSVEIPEVESGVILPDNLKPPMIKLSGIKKNFKTNKDYILDVVVKWEGDPKQYLIQVPKVEHPAAIEFGTVNSSSDSKDGNSHVRYHFPIRVAHEGKYLIGPIELGYQHRAGGKTLSTRIPAVEIEFKKSSDLKLILVVVGVFVALVIGFIIFLRRSKSSQKSDAVAEEFRREECIRLYEKVRLHEVQGANKDYILGVIELAFRIDPDLKERNRGLLESIRYGGVDLPEGHIRVFVKVVENFIEAPGD